MRSLDAAEAEAEVEAKSESWGGGSGWRRGEQNAAASEQERDGDDKRCGCRCIAVTCLDGAQMNAWSTMDEMKRQRPVDAGREAVKASYDQEGVREEEDEGDVKEQTGQCERRIR